MLILCRRRPSKDSGGGDYMSWSGFGADVRHDMALWRGRSIELAGVNSDGRLVI